MKITETHPSDHKQTITSKPITTQIKFTNTDTKACRTGTHTSIKTINEMKITQQLIKHQKKQEHSKNPKQQKQPQLAKVNIYNMFQNFIFYVYNLIYTTVLSVWFKLNSQT